MRWIKGFEHIPDVIINYDKNDEPIYGKSNETARERYTFDIEDLSIYVCITKLEEDFLERYKESYSIRVNTWADWLFIGTLEEAKVKALHKVDEFVEKHVKAIEEYKKVRRLL